MPRWVRMLLGTVTLGGAALATSPWFAPPGRLVGVSAALVAAVASVAMVRWRGDPGRATHEATHEELTATGTEALTRLQRRETIRMLGLGIVGAVPMMTSPGLISGFAGDSASGTSQQTSGTSHQPATTKDGRIRQWTMIVDLRRCDGCQSQGTPPQCTTACIEGHFAPEPMEWIEVYEADLNGGGTQFIPTPCQQCQNPPCVNVCPVGATFSTPEGIVLIDENLCIGCRICMAACPYDRRFFNWGNPPVPPEAALADYSEEHQVPARVGTVMKCDFCPDMVRAGSLPFCVQACPNDAMWYGDLEENIATNGRELVSASRFLSENSAYRQKENLGTKPRVYYIAGHGGLAGRDPGTPGRLRTEWPWVERVKGAVTWSR